MDNTTRFAAFAALFISLLAPSAPAQFPSSVTFSNDFNGDVPAGMTLTGSATVNGGYLKLTTHTPGGQLGTAFVDGLPSAQGVTAFRATFRAALFGGTIPPADGFSFNLAPAADASNGVTPGEEGLASGLTISFDTYDNGGEPPSISVRWNGILMGEQPVQVSTSPGGQSDPASRLRDFSIQLDSDGTVDVAHNGVFILNNLPTSYEPIYGGRWVLSARTGGFTDNHWFEDLNISATLTVPLSGNCLNLGGGFVEAAHHPSLNELPFAVGAWIRTTNQTQTGAGIVAKWAPNAQGNGFYMVMNAGRVVAFYGSATSALDNTLRSPLLADGQWHHVLFTVHFGAGTLWVDGQSADFLPSWEGQPAATTSTAPLLIGTWADGTNFIGEIDEVTLWSTADERFTVQRWNRRLSGFEPDLLAYYRFDEGSSNVAGDASGNGRTGQIRNNFAWVASAVPLLPGLDTLQIHGRVDSGDGTVTAAATAPVDIPDVATVESSMTVAAPGAIAGVKVNVNITHTFRGDLVITLIHPDGTAVILHNRDGGPDDDLVTTYPDLTAPAQSLAVLNGKPLNGTWVLRVQDAAGQDIGTLNTWSLELARPPQPPPPPMLMAALLDPATSASAAPVLDLRTNEYTLNVGAGDPVGFVQVDMDISHTFRGDLEISLIHPDGTAVRLKDADVNDDLADWVTSYADLTAPAQSLAAFNGKSMRGDWRLRVRDVFPGDAGTLNAWRLQLGRAPVLTATNGTYVFTNLGATTFYTVRPLASGFVFVPPSRRVQAGSTNVDFSVVSGVIAGRVTDGGAGVGGVTVSAGAASATTDAGGFYQLTGLPPGNYALNAALTGFGLAPASQNVPLGATNANFAIASYPVSGRIVDLATNGAPGVTVSIGALSAVTDNDGRYLIAQVPPGARVVTPSRGAALFNPASRSLNVNAALTGVDFILASAPPTISDLRDRVIARGTSTGAIRFDVNDTETRAARLVLTAASSDTSIVPPGGIVFGGVGNARTVTITPPPDRSGVVTITVTVTDESGLTASDSFTLRVNTAPLAGLGSALSFDGVNDAVLVPTNVIANKGNFTFECWAFAPSNAGPRAIAEQGGGTNFFSLSVDAAGLIRVGPWNTGVPFPFGNWRHIAVVKETTNARLYLDGVLRASRGSTIPLPAQSNRFDIGRSAAGQFWLGALDDLRVWEVSRTAAEIATNLNARLLGTETNLTALWRFDERSGTNAFDATPGARHGNVSGAAWVQSGARFDRYFTAEDVGFSDVLQAFDPDGDPLTFRLVTPAAQGTMTLTGTNTGAFTYTPAPNVSGEDRFTFSVSDGFVDSEISLLTVSMAPDTNAPVIELNFTVSPPYPEDSYPGVGFPFTVRDVETPPSNIVVTLFSSDPALVPVERLFFETEDLDTGARTLRVPPATNQSGTATIFIVADDGRQRATNSFEVTITPVNDVPFVSALTNQLTRRGVATAPQPFTFADVDTPVDNVTLSGAMNSGDLSLPANISVTGTGTNRAVTMTPVANRSGSVGISVLADDGVGGIGSSRYTVTVNDPPTIALTPVQSTFRNTPTRPIAITLGDVDDAVAGLTLSATSSNPALIPDNAFSFGGSGANRTLVVSPALGQFGVATITVTVRDPHWTVSTNLTLFVEQGLDYTFAELPTLPGHLSGQAESINDAGLAVGRSQPDEDDSAGIAPRRAVVWNTATSVPTVSTLNTLDAGPSWALAINQAGQIVGTRFGPSASAPNTGGSRAWVFRNGVATDLAFTLGVFNRGEGHDLNDSGVVVGATNSLAGQSFVFDGATATNLLRFRFDFDLDNIELVINNAGDLAGIATNAAARRTLLVQGDGTVRDLFARLGGTENNPSDINNVGEILGDVRIPTGVLKYPYIYNYRTDTLNTNLHTALAAIGLVQDYDTHEINDSGEAVGSAEDAAGTQYAWLYSDGRAYNLQDFVSPGVFRPKQARGINNAGDIVGVGRRPGDRDDRPFVMRRQWLVGQPVSPPVQAVNPATRRAYQPPRVEAIDGTPADQAANASLWSDLEQKLYFLRPMAARITWFTTSDLGNTNPPPPVVRVGRAVFPPDPQIHIAGAPVEVEPLTAASPYRAVAMVFSSVPSGAFDQGAKRLIAAQPGYSVIRYLIAPETPLGSTPDLLTHSNYFAVIRTVAWNDPAFLSNNVPAVIGTAVADPRGPGVATHSPKSGWVVFERSPYDGAGADAAYDRETQTGPIIPVNTEVFAGSDPLVVAFYRVSPVTGALWPDLPVRFNINWPVGAERLVIANSDGSGPLPPAQFPEKRIYHQPDRALPGFNPNEEHAFFAPSASGEGVFALRNDLNRATSSRNFVLLKHRHPISGQWVMKPYEVVLEDAAHGFTFHGEAGREILPPYPLGLFPICSGENQTRIISGDAFQDHRGKFYAKMGDTPADPNPQVVLRYFYPLQPEFFYDLNGDRVNDLPAGSCVQWNGIKPGAGAATPVDVTYRIHWPIEAPTLQIGEMLLDARRGLPGIRNFASAQVVFDSLNPTGTMPLSSTARLYDPLSARTLAITNVAGITASYRFPAEIALETRADGQQVFSDLPFHLRARLSYDPQNRRLSWSGVLNENVLGEPLLLINVMSRAERDRIKQLSGEANFQSLIEALYDLTRNPNRVNLRRPGQEPPDKDLLIGFITEYVARITNGAPPNATTTLQSFFGARPGGANLAVIATNIVQEPLGDLPKALTAGLPVPPSRASFGNAAQFNGNNGFVSLPDDTFAFPTNTPFTFECWFQTTNGGVILGQQGGDRVPYDPISSGYVPAIYVGTDGRLYVQMFWKGAANPITGPKVVADGVFHHLAVVFSGTNQTVYLDGALFGSADHTQISYAGAYKCQLGTAWTVGWPAGNNGWFNFKGLIDEVRVWNNARATNDLADLRFTPLTGLEIGLELYYRFDETGGTVARDSSTASRDGALNLAATRAASTIPIPAGREAPRYLVVAENNDPALGALQVTLHVIRVEGGPFRGDLKVLFPDNVFDERLTLRHSSDFGGDPDRIEFEWWYHPDDADFDPVALPVVNPANGQVTDARGWRQFRPPTAGQNAITIGDGAETSLFTLIDNWFIVRYRGYNVGGATNWSAWVGDPSSAADTRAAFAPGWVKRVIEGLNPFEARTTNFHDNASATYASMLIQAGERYEGDIALNPDGANLNSVGLIEAYTTVLNRGKRLSIDGLPPVDSDPANNALLLAASRIADFYMLLGNEAFSDAQDPTIGFFSDSLEFGTVATSIFAFQNQLDSLLEEELALLRGRDDSAAGVGARPVYNRLLWNFTGAEGEVAYERVYNVGDVNLDGVINENDARILFPQGHGDAWGHYLTAAKTYYGLLRHPRFTWIPRAESVLVGGTAVRVDFLDERKFAAIAAAKARAGSEIVDLTYRSKYVDNPEGQYQGYKDTRPDRAWGVTEWARRAGQGAYFDWLVGNAILPGVDPNTNHAGIQKIDRQTVLELDEVIAHHREVQAQLDKVDKGLNPLGLAKGVVPFDIDPNFLIVGSGIQGRAHFQQIYERAIATMNNSINMWDHANGLTEALRRQQDTLDEFTANVADQERDFKNRLIEVFGYPYAGDIGAGKTYPSGYDGPDIYHYQYVNATELTGRQPGPRGFTNVIGYFKPFQDGDSPPSFYFGGDLFTTNVASGPFLAVNYPLASGGWAFTAPPEFGSRRAPGEIQLALSDLLQEEARLKQALNNYDGLIQQIEDASQLLASRVALSNRTLTLLTGNRTQQVDLNSRITAAQDAQLGLRRIASIMTGVAETLVAALPSDIADAIIPIDEIAHAAYVPVRIAAEVLETGADIAEGQQNRFEKTKEETQLQTDIDLEIATQDFEVQQMAAELRQLLRSEAPMRLETLNQAELVRQSFDRYLAAVATGQRLLTERAVFRQRTAGLAQQNRYKDIAFRIFRNDALQKYRAQFDLAARYVYLVASAYDYELNFLGGDARAGRDFFTDIIRQRSLGQMVDGVPVTGRTGLSDPLARLKQNFDVLAPRFGLNNPQLEVSRFSLRQELFRIRGHVVPDLGADGIANTPEELAAAAEADAANALSDPHWQKLLASAVVPDLWQVPEFRRYCRPFAPEPAGPQPGIVIRFPTTITFGLNFFEHALGGGDSAYDPSLFSTKINSVGVWFSDYNGSGLATAPRIYLFPAGMDVLRSPTGNTLSTREWRVVDQAIPAPFPIGASDLDDPTWIPINDSLAESFAQIRRFSSFRAFHDNGVYDDTETTKTSRLVGRSVWNTDWVLIIPGGTLLNNPEQGLEQFIDSVSDILISLQSYSYSGD